MLCVVLGYNCVSVWLALAVVSANLPNLACCSKKYICGERWMLSTVMPSYLEKKRSHGHACHSAVCWSDVTCAQIPVPDAVHDEQAAQFLVNPVCSCTLCFHQHSVL